MTNFLVDQGYVGKIVFKKILAGILREKNKKIGIGRRQQKMKKSERGFAVGQDGREKNVHYYLFAFL